MQQLSQIELINQAITLGAKLVANVSGGKDGQAMTKAMIHHNMPIHCLLHMDLGMVEWKESIHMCLFSAQEAGKELFKRTRNDGDGLLEHAEKRMNKLLGQGKPFWYDSTNRYCMSDLKRDVANVFYTEMNESLIISCEGIRAQESTARGKKKPLVINTRKTSSYYDGMTVEEALNAFDPQYKLLLTWYPIFNYTVDEVWATYGMTTETLKLARSIFKETGVVPAWWPFHPAYAMGNDRVSCVICALASVNDMMNGIKLYPDVAEKMAQMEQISGYTFKKDFSITEQLAKLKAEENCNKLKVA